VGSSGTACHDRRRTPQQVEHYRDRLSGPLCDRIHLVLKMKAAPPDGIGATTTGE
jgi:predicted ATPase with chaperone activity